MAKDEELNRSVRDHFLPAIQMCERIRANTKKWLQDRLNVRPATIAEVISVQKDIDDLRSEFKDFVFCSEPERRNEAFDDRLRKAEAAIEKLTEMNAERYRELAKRLVELKLDHTAKSKRRKPNVN